jgi:hypothetical protein
MMPGAVMTEYNNLEAAAKVRTSILVCLNRST